MAKATMKLPEELLKKLSTLGKKTDEISEKVLTAGGEVILDKTKKNLAASVGNGTKYDSRSTGELGKALGLSPVKLDKNGNYNLKLGFAEPRSDGLSNAMLANIIEYGKSGQPPRPFLKPAVSSTKKAATQAMENKFSEEIKKL